MNRYRLFKAGIDYNDGLRRFNNNANMYESTLKLFLEDSSYPDMKKALAQKDVSAAFSAAHSLKGVAGNLSLVRLHSDIMPLVEELRAGSLDVDEFLPSVDQSYADAMAAIGAEVAH